ncbi:MAG TPA: hypothetical protein PLO33_14145 [Kouleothrix sp.]|uniref:hypothetical protein n=1 Tax=Kouleothrix sp. TaxID=2779161 RepID=UPI002CE03DAB|nr:hypothetical protein [Kouleothrix sp.]HRC76814.1 hypothetical protein [Kouleothrix sp.]
MRGHSWAVWAKYAAVLNGCSMALALSVLLGLWLGGVTLRPPDVQIAVGDLHVVAFTVYPSLYLMPMSSGQRCAQAAGCRTQLEPHYAIWIIDHQLTLRKSSRAFRQLATIPLSLAQLVESLST